MWKIKIYSSEWAQCDGHILPYTDSSVKNVVSYWFKQKDTATGLSHKHDRATP